MKTQYIIIVVLVVVVVGCIVYFWNDIKGVFTSDSPAITTKKTTTATTTTKSYCSTGTVDDQLTLKKGDKSRSVCELQSLLNASFSAGLTVDGDFGSKTEAAVKAAMNGAITTSIASVRIKIMLKSQNPQL